ncbi:unnamed protein product, partial [Protopolystoma xenopodis]
MHQFSTAPEKLEQRAKPRRRKTQSADDGSVSSGGGQDGCGGDLGSNSRDHSHGPTGPGHLIGARTSSSVGDQGPRSTASTPSGIYLPPQQQQQSGSLATSPLEPSPHPHVTPAQSVPGSSQTQALT